MVTANPAMNSILQQEEATPTVDQAMVDEQDTVQTANQPCSNFLSGAAGMPARSRSGLHWLVRKCLHEIQGIGKATWNRISYGKPLLFVPNSGRIAATDFDAPLAAPVGRAVSGNST